MTGFKSPGDAKRVIAGTRAIEDLLRSGGGSSRARPGFRSTSLVQITGAPVGGLHPARLVIWNAISATYEHYGEVKFKETAGRTLNVDDVTIGVWTGPTADGLSGIYAGDYPGAPVDPEAHTTTTNNCPIYDNIWTYDDDPSRRPCPGGVTHDGSPFLHEGAYSICGVIGHCHSPPCTSAELECFDGGGTLPVNMCVLISEGTGSFVRYATEPQLVSANYSSNPAGWYFSHSFPGPPRLGISGRLSCEFNDDPNLFFFGTMYSDAPDADDYAHYPCGCKTEFNCNTQPLTGGGDGDVFSRCIGMSDDDTQVIVDILDLDAHTQTMRMTSGCGTVLLTLLDCPSPPPPPPPPTYFDCIGGDCLSVGYASKYPNDPTCGSNCAVYYDCDGGSCIAVGYVTSFPNDPTCGGTCAAGDPVIYDDPGDHTYTPTSSSFTVELWGSGSDGGEWAVQLGFGGGGGGYASMTFTGQTIGVPINLHVSAGNSGDDTWFATSSTHYSESAGPDSHTPAFNSFVPAPVHYAGGQGGVQGSPPASSTDGSGGGESGGPAGDGNQGQDAQVGGGFGGTGNADAGDGGHGGESGGTPATSGVQPGGGGGGGGSDFITPGFGAHGRVKITPL